MRYIYIVFSSRRDSMVFYEALSSARVRSEIVSTPRKLNLSCGISIKTEERYISYVRRILYNGEYRSFSGIYLANNGNFELVR